MTTKNTDLSVPSEFDDEVDDALLPPGRMWAYPCKLASCPDYGKSWQLRSNFLLHLQEREAHIGATTPTARRAVEIEWRYPTDPDLPPRAPPEFRPQEDADEQAWTYSFKNGTGRAIHGTCTQSQMEAAMASRRR
ncbi:hypothetical protein BKA67DRAFT_579887 [Truncatella angustata]|uniref:C2H2-type domain-containing protein n=1 Tax=Truncatella angustata TaxID=152316 RepID=A0A9P8U9N9_9PEZI|nr:uncharacterized protein BKA67DRAFT_579887 [Truncatella angustata]KAH6646519.1 hypothetical protein BKA67DRAFT_579887 [Truncatella angustata]